SLAIELRLGAGTGAKREDSRPTPRHPGTACVVKRGVSPATNPILSDEERCGEAVNDAPPKPSFRTQRLPKLGGASPQTGQLRPRSLPPPPLYPTPRAAVERNTEFVTLPARV